MSTYLRVTDKDTMEITEMVFAKVNKERLRFVEFLGVECSWNQRRDGGLETQCYCCQTERTSTSVQGDSRSFNWRTFMSFSEQDLPIIFPVGYDENCDSYNNVQMTLFRASHEVVQREKACFSF